METITSYKLAALAALVVLTYLFGTLPYFLVLRGSRSLVPSRRRNQVIKYMNCFGGGVFLGALLLHLMVEGSEEFDNYKTDAGLDIDFPVFNACVAGGFFLVALIEYFMHGLLSHNKQEGHGHNDSHSAIDNTNDTLPQPNVESGNAIITDQYESCASTIRHASDASLLRAFLLLTALSFHTIFDGLAVGIQEKTSELWQMFAAVSIHKSIMTFCLGQELYSKYINAPWKALLWLTVFAIMSPIGIAIGISVTSGNIKYTAKELSSGILQGVASGTFMYVTFLEILNHYWSNARNRSVLDIFFAFIGFAAMAGVKYLDKD